MGQIAAIKWRHADRIDKLVGAVGYSCDGDVCGQAEAVSPYSLLVSWITSCCGLVPYIVDFSKTLGSYTIKKC